jgi:hypothetical protein
MMAPVKGRFRNAARLLHDSPARSGHYVGHWCGVDGTWPLEPQLSVCVEMRSGDDGPFLVVVTRLEFDYASPWDRAPGRTYADTLP